MSGTAKAMREVSLLQGLPDSEIDALASKAIVREYGAEAVVVRQDEPGEALYIVLSGEVKVTLYSESGREVMLDMLSEGAIFGEMSLIDAAPRSASVVTTRPTRLLYLGRSDFQRVLAEHPEISMSLLIELCRRLREADAKIRDLVLEDVQGRVARFIFRLAKEKGAKVAGGYMIERRPTHLEMAGLLGASRETISRAMSDLIKKGYFKQQGRKLFIPLQALLKP